MTNITIQESGLNFTVDTARAFLPEKEDFYARLSTKVSVKICDIVYLNPSEELLFIEVKSSSPRDNREFVKDIKQKFVDSLLVYVGAVFDRKNTQATDLPVALKEFNVLKRKMRLVLIVKNHKPEWLPPLRDSLQKECRALERLFSLEDTQVYNQQLARQKLQLCIDEIED
jgi:hypothetical protein